MDLRGALGTAMPPVQNNFWSNFKERSSASLVDTFGSDTRHYRVTMMKHIFVCPPRDPSKVSMISTKHRLSTLVFL